MESFLVAREKALAASPPDPAAIETMRSSVASLEQVREADAFTRLQLQMFVQKGHALLARLGFTDPHARRATILRDALMPASPVCTYYDSGGIKVIIRGDPSRKEIALTYDDGPCEGESDLLGTRALLDVLDEVRARATFFMIGQNAELHPDLVREVRRRGHSIANHTKSHARGVGLPRLSESACHDEVGTGRQQILEALGVDTPMPLFRLPYGAGAHTERVNQIVGEYHQFSVFWTIDSRDWTRPGYDKLVNSVLGSNLKEGAIVLFHDHGPHVPRATRAIVTTLAAQGFRFITLDEMLGQDLRTTFRERFCEAADLASKGDARKAYDAFLALGGRAPTVAMAREALDYAYQVARTGLTLEAATEARRRLTASFTVQGAASLVGPAHLMDMPVVGAPTEPPPDRVPSARPRPSSARHVQRWLATQTVP